MHHITYVQVPWFILLVRPSSSFVLLRKSYFSIHPAPRNNHHYLFISSLILAHYRNLIHFFTERRLPWKSLKHFENSIIAERSFFETNSKRHTFFLENESNDINNDISCAAPYSLDYLKKYNILHSMLFLVLNQEGGSWLCSW